MINLTRIWTGVEQPADNLRYGTENCRGTEPSTACANGHSNGHSKSHSNGHSMGHAGGSASSRRPVVVWSITQTCNLRCIHCYADSEARVYPGELNPEECDALLEDLAAFKVPVLLLSGGEPLVHPRFFEIAERARSLGLRLTLSTNGTKIDKPTAERLKEIGFGYVGISLDGIGDVHDYFRGKRGAFKLAVRAFESCMEVDQKCGLRLTLTRHNAYEIDSILNFIERVGIPRVCFYHLVPSGRGQSLELLPPDLTRSVLTHILARIDKWREVGINREVLTVDQPADAVFLLNQIRARKPERFEEAQKLLNWNGGGLNSTGIGIANIDAQGNVHPDQFWQDVTVGSIREKPFSKIWGDPDHELLLKLRDKRAHLTGRCATCQHLSFCGGGFRARAAHVTGDPWASDPGCYLMDNEIAVPVN